MGRQRNRLVVLDLSWLRSRPTASLRLPPGALYLIPDGLFAEISGASNPHAQAAKVWNLARLNRGVFALGKSLELIIDEEHKLQKALRGSEIISWSRTHAFLKCLDDNPKLAWLEGVAATRRSEVFVSHEQKRANWIDFCNGFVSFLTAKGPDEAASLRKPEQRLAWIRSPALFAEGAGSWFPEYSGVTWRDRLNTFPDVFGVGRWLRILAWSAAQRVAGRTRGLPNDWEDAQYALLASYAGRLVTKDNGLKELVAAAFPGVRCLNIRSCRQPSGGRLHEAPDHSV